MIYKKSGRRFPFALCLLLFAFCQSACNVTKHLDEAKGERLLVKNSFELKSVKKLRYSQRAPLQYELSGLYKQKASRRSWIPFRKFLPTIYDKMLTQKTAQNFENQVKQRGYFDAKCTFETKLAGKHKAKVKYTVSLGPLYTIDTLRFESRDSVVQEILRMTAEKSLLKRSSPVDGRVFDAEKLRIAAELKNRGYAYFAPNFIEFEGDSSGTHTNVTAQILTPGDSALHKTYTIGDIQVFSSVRPEIMGIRNDTLINGIYFGSATSIFRVKPQRLYRSIAIKPGFLYKQEDFDKTLRNFSALGVYRFVSVKPKQDTIDPEKIDVEILLTSNKRISLGADVDLNSSISSSAIARNLLGISGSLSFRNRNLFRGAENLQTSVQYNIEFDVATRNRFIFSEEFKVQNLLVFPRFFDYLGLWKRTSRFKKSAEERPAFYQKLKENAQARLSFNYDYLDLIDFYDYNLFNASFGYDLSDGEHRYSFDHVGIDILRPRTRPQFDSIFGQNEFLKRSFGNQLFSGFFLRNFSYIYSGNTNRFGEHWTFRFNNELSGLEELTLNRLWSAIFGKQKWSISDLDFAQYLRLDMDAVYTRDFRRDLTGVVRIGSGVVVPIGDTKDAPYVKQFFVGGPTSIRAWRIREIGPGGYVPRDDAGNPAPPTVQPFFQAADFRFEFNGELRFNIFSSFKGAVFVDGGNIWTLKFDPKRSGSQLRWDSYKNIAIGTGVGVRGDFSYLIIRFDVGLPLRNPYPDAGGRYWVRNIIPGFRWSDVNPNLAVGLPF